MRTASVLVPRSTSHASNGPMMAPAAFCTNFSHSMCSSRTQTTMPPTLSLWPLRYFVVLWMTMSAPRARGCCRHGLAKVLSTTSARPRGWVMAAIAAMSESRMTGLVGVSTNTIFVAGSMARATAAGSDVSTYVKRRPDRVSTRSNSRYVPPYVLSVTMT